MLIKILMDLLLFFCHGCGGFDVGVVVGVVAVNCVVGVDGVVGDAEKEEKMSGSNLSPALFSD